MTQERGFIKPTVGRVVYYWPTSAERAFIHNQPFAAQICHVWSDTCVNLSIKAENGKIFTRESCTMAQGREATGGECGWMPYQVGQAAKDPA